MRSLRAPALPRPAVSENAFAVCAKPPAFSRSAEPGCSAATKKRPPEAGRLTNEISLAGIFSPANDFPFGRYSAAAEKEAEVYDEYPDGKKFEEVWIPVKKKASFAVNVTGRRLFSVTSGLEQVSALMKAHPVRSAYRTGCAFSFTAAGSLAPVHCAGGFQPLMRPAVSNSALP